MKRKNRRGPAQRAAAVLLCACMLFPSVTTEVAAEAVPVEEPGFIEETAPVEETAERTEEAVPVEEAMGLSEEATFTGEDVPTEGVTEPAGEAALAEGVTEPAGEAAPTEGVTEPAGEAAPTEEVTEPAGEAAPAEGVTEPAGEAAPMEEVTEPAADGAADAGNPDEFSAGEDIPGEASSYPLAEAAVYGAYDNGSMDGAGATAYFQAIMPAGTEFYLADGTPADPAQTPLMLNAWQYGDNYEENKALLDAHMAAHTEGERTADYVQFWRVWLVDAYGEEITVKLPAGATVEVTAEYLPGADGTYPGALLGELNVLCTGVMDMGRPGEGVSWDAFTGTDQYTFWVSSDPGKTQRAEDRYIRITYYITAWEDGSSAWGNVTAFAALEPDVPEADASDSETPEENSPEADTPDEDAAEENSPETDTPDSETPEENPPEADAPDSETPEENPPETDAPDSKTPEENPPETDVPDSETPEENSPETDAPQAAVFGTALMMANEERTQTIVVTAGTGTIVFEIQIDYSSCDPAVAADSIADVGVSISTQSDESLLQTLCQEQGYELTSYMEFGRNLRFTLKEGVTAKDLAEAAVTIRLSRKMGTGDMLDNLRISDGVFAAFLDDEALEGPMEGIQVTDARPNSDASGYEQITIETTYGKLVPEGRDTSTAFTVFTGNRREEAPEEIPQELLERMAAENGIYPGTKTTVNGQEVWTAYDGTKEESAAVKATVTLPAGISAKEGHYLYIRKVEEGERYFPKEEALQAAVGTYNDAQCYAIHWVQVYQKEDGTWDYNVQTESVLGDVTATVEIEYQKEEACLGGHKANRKLQVYNSRLEDGSDLEEASTPVEVTADDNAYTGFTFTTNRGGPYVFVSQYVYEGSVKSVTINSIADGVAPFDADNEAGNDSGDNNRIIRSYDAITYNLTVNFEARSNTATAKDAVLYYEMTMDADITEAVFDTDQMLWADANYTIEYLNGNGEVVLTQKSDGKYYKADGVELSSLNEIVSDSSQGTGSYSTSIVRQRFRGSRTLEADQNLLAANQTLNIAVQVLGADNGKILQPVFRAWFDGNEENYGSESAGEGGDVQLAEKNPNNTVAMEPVTVSAAARFNLGLAENTNVSYKGWFDFRTGKAVNNGNGDAYSVGTGTVTGGQLYELLENLANLPENIGKSNPETFTDSENACASYLQGQSLWAYGEVFQNIRYGRMTGYGISLQIYNAASDNQNTASKGFRGVSLPQGSLTFDLELLAQITEIEGDVQADQYYARLWEYNENVSNENSGNQNRNMYWANLASTRYAAWAAPYNGGGGASGCYSGGGWSMGEDYHFTVSGYDLNFLFTGLEFPTHRAGNSSETTGYNTYIGNFSAGYIQVLNVCPRYQAGTLNMDTQVTVKNLTVTTTGGQSIAPDPSEATGYAHETNTGDNCLTDNIPLYAKGGITKANAFCNAALFDKKTVSFTSKDYFLGTDFWGTSYDSSAFAGQDITLVGAARIGAGDYQIRHMNMLQLFDSEALSIAEGKKPYVVSHVSGHREGDTTILYAADPDYPQGYNTNNGDVMRYMSTVREEDLLYFEDPGTLRAAGYTCVGVMAELRNWVIDGEGGYSTELRIPMKVSQEERFLGETVGTVNAVRIWTNAGDMEDGTVSWKNGQYSGNKNSVAGYTPVNSHSDENYSGESANGSPYVKAEYANGQVILGSNTGGYVYGNTLLILSYKSEVDIEVDNGGDGALPTFDLDKGNYTVNYRLKDMIAKTDETIGNAQNTKTNLTVLAKLDIDRKAGETQQRIAVEAGSYGMEPASERMVLTDEWGNVLGTQSAPICSDPDNPTIVHYAFRDETTNEVDTSEIYTIQVYARRDTNGNQVAFEVKNAPIGVSLPDIMFDAGIQPETVKDSDRIHAAAYISGTSDVRAYSETAGNMDKVTIGISQLVNTRLVKAVDKDYIELDGVYTYTVSYTNKGQDQVDVYLYDLLPVTGDIRGSRYEGTAILRKIDANLSGGETFTADIDFYYSKLPYRELYDKVRVFGDDGGGRSTENIREMLTESGDFQLLGSIGEDTGHELKYSDQLTQMDNVALTREMSEITGIYAVVNGLGGNRTLSVKLTVETDGNRAGDLYRNIANSWLGNTSEPLTSNRVETSVISRTISGMVWDDGNLNGMRDSDEMPVSGVTCTLFRLDEDEKTSDGGKNPTYGQYVLCEKDVTGEEIRPLVTGADGTYCFDKLAEGEYIVAFSGEALGGKDARKYEGATVYQVKDGSSSRNNDGVALTGTKGSIDTEVSSIAGIDGNTYRYVIAYRMKDNQVNAASLHTIEEILGENISLVNDVELHANLDLGLVIANYRLPETGGPGTDMYTIGGLLTIGAGLLLLYKKKTILKIQKRKERTV